MALGCPHLLEELLLKRRGEVVNFGVEEGVGLGPTDEKFNVYQDKPLSVAASEGVEAVGTDSGLTDTGAHY